MNGSQPNSELLALCDIGGTDVVGNAGDEDEEGRPRDVVLPLEQESEDIWEARRKEQASYRKTTLDWINSGTVLCDCATFASFALPHSTFIYKN